MPCGDRRRESRVEKGRVPDLDKGGRGKYHTNRPFGKVWADEQLPTPFLQEGFP
jgi:hypothetical protein